MKNIKFNEIIECSSQQSLLSGQAGFGIRTITEGFSPDLARKISEQVNAAYEVDIADQVTAAQIKKDVNCVSKYPRTLKYALVKDEDNNDKYVVACSTYVGVDYGYFCDVETARRVGTNYIADILVFDERPTPALFTALLEQKTFLPRTNDCDPNNPELKELLTGEPAPLKPREIELEETSDTKTDIHEDTAWIAIALLQTKINAELGKPKELTNIIFQAKEAKVPSIMRALSLLPEELVSDKYFHTNYLQGYGMPTGYRMMFLNEHNKEQVYTEDYVYLNLDEHQTKNIDTDNYFFGKLKEAAIANDYDAFCTLVNHLLQMSAEEILKEQTEEQTEEQAELTTEPETSTPQASTFMAKFHSMGNTLVRKLFKKKK